MSEHNLFSKKLKKHYLSINLSIENYFNKLKININNIKKLKFGHQNRVFLTICAIIILSLSYFLIPTFSNKDIIQTKIKNHILKKYNIELKFNEKIRYGLLPKPHFAAKNLSIMTKDGEIGLVKNFKAHIAVNKLFQINDFEIKNLIFKKTDFRISKKDLAFFSKLLKTPPNENKIIFKDSNIFFKNQNDEILFINKIYNSQFLYDSNNLQNVLSAKNEIFNVPYKLSVKNDKFNKKILIKFNSKKIRLSLENEIDYNDIVKNGLLDILFVNKNTSLNYKIEKNFLQFASKQKNFYNGKIDFKPFYLNADLNYDGVSSRNLFKENSIMIDLIKSEFLNNKNLNAKINLKVNDITNIDELNDLSLVIEFEEGGIKLSDSSIMWKNDLKINLNESLINYNSGEITLIGKLILEFKDLSDFYRFFQIKKNNRKIIDEIQLDFVYNFDQKKISFDNVKIDDKSNTNIDEFINNYNDAKEKIFNKITFKNFINNFFNAYEG